MAKATVRKSMPSMLVISESFMPGPIRRSRVLQTVSTSSTTSLSFSSTFRRFGLAFDKFSFLEVAEILALQTFISTRGTRWSLNDFWYIIFQVSLTSAREAGGLVNDVQLLLVD